MTGAGTGLLPALALALAVSSPPPGDAFRIAAANGERSEEAFRRVRRMLRSWLGHADSRTLLLPDYLPRFTAPGVQHHLYTPQNSGADNYPYLVVAAFFTDRPLYEGRLREMLRNEVRYTTTAGGLPGELRLADASPALPLLRPALGHPPLLGAAEYAKDGLLAITERLGRTPWFDRMVALTELVMSEAAVASDFGPLPDPGAEINGDVLQVLARLVPMTFDSRVRAWGCRIADAYVYEVLPRNHGLPGYTWDFQRHRGENRMRLRDHGNEIVAGLVLLYALEEQEGTVRAAPYRAAIRRMLDRVLESANPDGMLYDEIRPSDLRPLDARLSDNWGYVYGAAYTFGMVTGESRYREAVRRVLGNLPRYRGHDWEGGRQDGLADAMESVLYLVAREPVPEALDWIESEMPRLMAFQSPDGDGTVEGAYPDGNWARTLLLYALAKTQGAHVEDWEEGVRLGAFRSGETLFLSLQAPPDWRGRLVLDSPRHRRVLNLPRNFVRVNEWPEYFTVDEIALYRLVDGGGERTLLGAELTAGVPIRPGRWRLEPVTREQR